MQSGRASNDDTAMKRTVYVQTSLSILCSLSGSAFVGAGMAGCTPYNAHYGMFHGERQLVKHQRKTHRSLTPSNVGPFSSVAFCVHESVYRPINQSSLNQSILS